MIFNHIWDAKTANKVFDNVRTNQATLYSVAREFRSGPCVCFRLNHLPLHVQHQVAGLQTARAAATAYHKAVHPERLQDDIHDMRAFLTRAHLHLGLRPAEHIRHICVGISP
jgi:hypothetical protein